MPTPRRHVLSPLLLAAVCTACGGDAERPGEPSPGADDGSPRFAFREAGAEAGLAIPLTCGATPGVKATILEVNGNGAALADLDGDGALDVVLVDGSTRAAFLEGRPVSHHVLLRTSRPGEPPRYRALVDHGLVSAGWPTGVVAGDVDGDGRTDLVVGGLGEDALFLNRAGPDGALRFEKQVLPGRADGLDWTTSLALADADGDGRPDLYLARYLTIDPVDPPLDRIGSLPCRYRDLPVMCGPQGLPAQRDVFLRGRAGPPWFDEASATAGLEGLPAAYGLGLLFADLDEDGWPDLYVANDSVDNLVLRNDGAGGFEDVSRLSGAASDMAGRAQAGMGAALGDTDGDGDPDLVVTNFADEANTLYRNDGALQFRDVSLKSGLGHVSQPLLGWGVHLLDLDGDGHLDLFWTNGHVYPEADQAGGDDRYEQPLVLLPGRGDGRFDGDAWPLAGVAAHRGSVAGDLDDDGDLDLLVLVLDGPPRLFLNQQDRPERQLLVDLRDGPRQAFAARLLLTTDAGVLERHVLSASSFQCASDHRLALALDGPPRAAEVIWPGGERQALDPADLAPGAVVTVRRGQEGLERRPLAGQD